MTAAKFGVGNFTAIVPHHTSEIAEERCRRSTSAVGLRVKHDG